MRQLRQSTVSVLTVRALNNGNVGRIGGGIAVDLVG